MLIVKHEYKELADRQVTYFRRTEAMRVSDAGMHPTLSGVPDYGYIYEYVPGQMCFNVKAVVEYLQEFVWNQEPLDNDEGRYHAYILTLCELNDIVFPNVVQRMIMNELCKDGDACLVHGDATMENFLQTDRGVVGIDPGLPRGLYTADNDVGKILQSVLTCWELVRHGVECKFSGYGVLNVSRNSLVSLLCHWVRIVKNRDRHPSRVEDYARGVVLPKLCQELVDSSRYGELPYSWCEGRLHALGSYFYKQARDYAEL